MANFDALISGSPVRTAVGAVDVAVLNAVALFKVDPLKVGVGGLAMQAPGAGPPAPAPVVTGQLFPRY